MITCENIPVTLADLAAFAVATLSGQRTSMIELRRAAPAQKRNPPLNIREVRAELIRRGYSVSAWARRYGKRPQYVQLAVRGQRRGPIARDIVAELRKELGL